MDTTLINHLKKEVEKEKAKKKKKPKIDLKKEKRLMYYSGWHKEDKPVTESEEERQQKLA